eukprot:7773757-Alexandrium_andersonii.AAC.1
MYTTLESGTKYIDRGRPVARGVQLKAASVNIRTTLRPAVFHQLSDYVAREGVAIMALQETKTPSNSQFVVGN